jgi:endonuclease/exonuclease/phosphatase family metal-dependent hydrolase
MKLLTLNLNGYAEKHGPWERRRERIIELLGRERPDVLALQAVATDPARDGGLDQATQLARARPEYGWLHVEPPDLAGLQPGSAFLSRLPLHDIAALPLTPRPGCADSSPRVALHACIALPLGPLHVFNAHLSWVPAQAAENLRELLPWVASFGAPAIVAGDLNTPADSPLLDALRDRGFRDLWQQLRGDEPGPTFESHDPSLRIDFVWASAALAARARDIERLDGERDGEHLSDHLGLSASFRA